MEPIIVLVAKPSTDLSPLTRHLWAQRIPHRVVANQQGEQCLLLANPADESPVREWVQLWREGELNNATIEKQPRPQGWGFALAMSKAPVSALSLLVLVLVFVWMQFSNDWQAWLSSGQHLWPSQRLSLQTYVDIGLWEMYRPVLLHFSLMHIIFNGLWWWILAPQIERLDGVKALLMILFLCGLLGNSMQWWYAGPAFGGASGITMGMLGWVGIRLKKVPYPFPPMLLPVMVGIMLVTIFADVVVPGITGTAHGAHMGGLLTGLLLGLLWPSKHQATTD